MASKIREKVLNCKDLKTQVVDVPVWNVKIMVKTLTGKQRAKILEENIIGGRPNLEKIYPKLLAASCYDPDTGEPIFDEADVDALNEKNGAILEYLANIAMQISGMSQGAVEAAKNDSK